MDAHTITACQSAGSSMLCVPCEKVAAAACSYYLSQHFKSLKTNFATADTADWSRMVLGGSGALHLLCLSTLRGVSSLDAASSESSPSELQLGGPDSGAAESAPDAWDRAPRLSKAGCCEARCWSWFAVLRGVRGTATANRAGAAFH